MINWNLKKRITDLHRTQADFAELAKVSESFVSRVITGRRELNINKQAKWAKLLNCKIKEIFKGD